MADKQAFSTTDGVTDRLYVATNLNIPVNPDFVPVMDTHPPVEPPSLDSLFGPVSGIDPELIGDFQRFYDQNTHTWSDGDIVPADFKGDVLAAQTAIEIWQAADKVYNDEYTLQKDIQWRVYCADKMIAFVA